MKIKPYKGMKQLALLAVAVVAFSCKTDAKKKRPKKKK